MAKIGEKSVKKKHPGSENLTPGGPGRPKGQRNYATIYREALIKIAAANDKSPEEIETMMEEMGIKHALKGNFQFWKDIRDRIHGKPQERHDITSGGKPIPLMTLDELRKDISNNEDSEPNEED